MAKLLMGSIVTKAVGRINGHCFRIQGTTQILQRNPLRGFQNAINKNKALPAIRNVLSSWLGLGSTAWDAWGVIARDNPVVDRFGNSLILKGRAFYTKCAINCAMVKLSTPFYWGWSNRVPECAFSEVRIDISGESIDLLDFVNTPDTMASFRIMPLRNESVNPNPTTIPIRAIFNSSTFDRSVLFNSLVTVGGFHLVAGQLYYCAVTIVSPSGVVSVTRAMKTVAF